MRIHLPLYSWSRVRGLMMIDDVEVFDQDRGNATEVGIRLQPIGYWDTERDWCLTI
jgi:hypothetical protein